MKRKEREGHGTSDDDLIDPIPNDLTEEILSRLPGTSLTKFQYVSKTWFSIIRSQRFIDYFHSNRSSRLLITFNNGQFTEKNAEKRLFFFSASNEGENNKSSSSLVANLDMILPSTDDYCYTQATLAHGLICCSYQGRFLICNPTTKQIITLPQCEDDLMKSTYNYLGYDPINHHYKALCVTISLCDHNVQEHKVLTLGGDNKKDLAWRKIEENVELYDPLTEGICINGVVYYGAITRPNMDRVIVCFDVRSDKISLVKSPNNITNWDRNLNLINYKGNLAVIHSKFLSNNFILWILENVEKHEWLEKTCHFPPPWNCLDRYSYSFVGINLNKTGEIILAPNWLPRKVRPFYIFYYDLESFDLRRVRLEGIADDKEFRRRYGIGKNGVSRVSISSEYFENITFY